MYTVVSFGCLCIHYRGGPLPLFYSVDADGLVPDRRRDAEYPASLACLV